MACLEPWDRAVLRTGKKNAALCSARDLATFGGCLRLQAARCSMRDGTEYRLSMVETLQQKPSAVGVPRNGFPSKYDMT